MYITGFEVVEWHHAGRSALGEERLAEALRVAHPGCSSSFTMGPRCVQGNYKLQTGEQTNKQSCRRRLQLSMGWAHSLSVTLAQCTHLVIFKCCEQQNYKCCYCCALSAHPGCSQFG